MGPLQSPQEYLFNLQTTSSSEAKRLIESEVHERSYGRLIRDWEDYKQQSLNS